MKKYVWKIKVVGTHAWSRCLDYANNVGDQCEQLAPLHFGDTVTISTGKSAILSTYENHNTNPCFAGFSSYEALEKRTLEIPFTQLFTNSVFICVNNAYCSKIYRYPVD